MTFDKDKAYMLGLTHVFWQCYYESEIDLMICGSIYKQLKNFEHFLLLNAANGYNLVLVLEKKVTNQMCHYLFESVLWKSLDSFLKSNNSNTDFRPVGYILFKGTRPVHQIAPVLMSPIMSSKYRL